jgi:hypothetical protein
MVPGGDGETRLAKYLKHPGRLEFEEQVRILMYAKELQLVPHDMLKRCRKAKILKE